MVNIDDVEALISANIDELTESIVAGSAQDYAHYRYLCGIVRGCNRTLEEIKAAVRHDDDRDRL